MVDVILRKAGVENDLADGGEQRAESVDREGQDCRIRRDVLFGAQRGPRARLIWIRSLFKANFGSFFPFRAKLYYIFLSTFGGYWAILISRRGVGFRFGRWWQVGLLADQEAVSKYDCRVVAARRMEFRKPAGGGGARKLILIKDTN